VPRRQPPADVIGAIASFDSSLVPMLIADDRRRYVDVNRAACLLLRSTRKAVLDSSIDDLTPPESRADAAGLWDAFLNEGTQSGTFELLMPDGPRLRVDYSATANIEPGRHLSILLVATGEDPEPGAAADLERPLLTGREREVLALIAMGDSSAAIATKLAISSATVETHVRHCVTKLGAKNRAHAITLGLQRGEIGIDLGPPGPQRLR
jgi:DNA-binding CsgD family transcriptional regulator